MCEFPLSGREDCGSVHGNGWGLLWLCSSGGGDAFLLIHGMLECTLSPFRFWLLPQFLSHSPSIFSTLSWLPIAVLQTESSLHLPGKKTDYWGGRGRRAGGGVGAKIREEGNMNWGMRWGSGLEVHLQGVCQAVWNRVDVNRSAKRGVCFRELSNNFKFGMTRLLTWLW